MKSVKNTTNLFIVIFVLLFFGLIIYRHYYNISATDFKRLINHEITMCAMSNFRSPKRIEELIHFIEYDIACSQITNNSSVYYIKQKQDLIKYLKRNKNKLTFEFIHQEDRDTIIYLLYNKLLISYGWYYYPNIGRFAPNRATFHIPYSAFKDSLGNDFYSLSLQKEINEKIRSFNQDRIDFILKMTPKSKKEIQKYPFIYSYSNGTLSNFFNVDIDIKFDNPHHHKIYIFLDSIAKKQKLSSIITTCYYFDLQ